MLFMTYLIQHNEEILKSTKSGSEMSINVSVIESADECYNKGYAHVCSI